MQSRARTTPGNCILTLKIWSCDKQMSVVTKLSTAKAIQFVHIFPLLPGRVNRKKWTDRKISPWQFHHPLTVHIIQGRFSTRPITGCSRSSNSLNTNQAGKASGQVDRCSCNIVFGSTFTRVECCCWQCDMPNDSGHRCATVTILPDWDGRSRAQPRWSIDSIGSVRLKLNNNC
ncbi:hypothetical protein T07_10001 [Trichinella nelsoni]|uniref:Uncharacterized protein n=1 Tax=Trichinella nelsoni TaxID=6336 RepID=A0A0V0SJQ4_9BILA|nr:hypothetical protein T07_10001 [Trichinella nelsoni]